MSRAIITFFLALTPIFTQAAEPIYFSDDKYAFTEAQIAKELDSVLDLVDQEQNTDKKSNLAYAAENQIDAFFSSKKNIPASMIDFLFTVKYSLQSIIDIGDYDCRTAIIHFERHPFTSKPIHDRTKEMIEKRCPDLPVNSSSDEN